jgi:hypothetical protein
MSVVMGTERDSEFGGQTSGSIDWGWAEDMAGIIYALAYDAADKRQRAAKIAAITDWLRGGDLKPGELVQPEALANEWRAYDAQGEEAE